MWIQDAAAAVGATATRQGEVAPALARIAHEGDRKRLLLMA